MPPLFILSPPRSFTSVTCAMLGCHPEAFGLAEVNLFAGETMADMQELYRDRNHLSGGLLRSLSELAFAEQTEETIEAVRRWLRDNASMSTAELFRTMQEWAGDKILIDKSPLHTFTPEALPRMAANFPDARYLHLTRHPGDTVTSVLELQQRVRDLVRGKGRLAARLAQRFDTEDPPTKFWLAPHVQILEFLETVPDAQQMRLRGEDLLSDPPRHLARIAEWLGIRTDRAAIDAMMHPENSPFAKYGPKNARFGNDPNFLERPQLRPYSYTPRPLTWKTPGGAARDLSAAICEYAVSLGY